MKQEPRISREEADALVEKKTAPRVTKEFIDSKIKDIAYFRVGDATMICAIEMHNRFVFVGQSGAADTRNFDEEVCRCYAYDDAYKKIWSHEGYVLRTRMYEGW